MAALSFCDIKVAATAYFVAHRVHEIQMWHCGMDDSENTKKTDPTKRNDSGHRRAIAQPISPDEGPELAQYRELLRRTRPNDE